MKTRATKSIQQKFKRRKLDIFIDVCQIGFAKLRSMTKTDDSHYIYEQYHDQCTLSLNDKKYPSQQIRSSVLCRSLKHTGK